MMLRATSSSRTMLTACSKWRGRGSSWLNSPGTAPLGQTSHAVLRAVAAFIVGPVEQMLERIVANPPNRPLSRPESAEKIGAAGGILVASHVFGVEMRAMVEEPERRREIDDQLRDADEALTVTSNPIPVKTALNLLGHRVGGLRLPLVEADEHEQATIRGALERHGLLEAAGSTI